MIRIACLVSRGDHAAHCPHCRRAAAQDRAVRAIADAVALPAVSPRARDQAFASALVRPVTAAPPWWRRAMAPAGLALAAAAASVVMVALAGPAEPQPEPGRKPVAVATGAPVAIGHGRVTLSDGGMAWRTGDTEVLVIAGRLDVEVDPATHRPFRVRTQSFVVDVVGTVFSVNLDGVVVTRGAVKISAPDGSVLVDRLAAGQPRWNVRIETATYQIDPAIEEDGIEMLDQETPTMEDTPRDPFPTVRGAVPKLPTPASPSAKELLDTARNQLTRKEVSAARATVKHLIASKPDRSTRADAEALLADSYVVDGDVDTAITLYLGVADRYKDLKFGEAALFTAAQLEMKGRHFGEARRLYQAYLARYPDGALADHARAQLRKLEPK